MSAVLKTSFHTQQQQQTDIALQELRSQGFVQYHPMLADKLGSFKAALFLGHALYWSRHVVKNYGSRDGWFFLSAKQCTVATGLTAREQASARQLLVEHKLVSEMLAGRPAKLHFKVDLQELVKLIGTTDAQQALNWQQQLALLNNCVSFYRPLADITGNVTSGLYLSYLLQQQRHFLTYPRRGSGFTISQNAVRIALCLGPKTQRNARDRLKQIGLLIEHGNLVQLNLHALCALLQCQQSRQLKTSHKPVTEGNTVIKPDARPLSLVTRHQPSSLQVDSHPAPRPNSRRLFGMAEVSQKQLFGLQSAVAPVASHQANANTPMNTAQSFIVNALRSVGNVKPGRLFGARHLAGKQQPLANSQARIACQTVAETAKLESALSAQNADLLAENAKLTCRNRETKLPKTQNINTTKVFNTTTTREEEDETYVKAAPEAGCSRRENQFQSHPGKPGSLPDAPLHRCTTAWRCPPYSMPAGTTPCSRRCVRPGQSTASPCSTSSKDSSVIRSRESATRQATCIRCA